MATHEGEPLIAASRASLAHSDPRRDDVKVVCEIAAETQREGLLMSGRAVRKREQKVTLTDGSQVTLDRGFSEYTNEELAAIGLTPGLGEATTVELIPAGSHGARVSVRVATGVAIFSGVLVGIVVALWRVPMSSVDTYPRECFATFGNTVSCGSGPGTFGLAAGAAMVPGALTYLALRRVPSRRLQANSPVK